MAGALVNIKLLSTCGSTHGHLEASVNGGAVQQFDKYITDLDGPISQDERAFAMTVFLKLLKIGRTNGQLAALLSGAGVTINFGNP